MNANKQDLYFVARHGDTLTEEYYRNITKMLFFEGHNSLVRAVNKGTGYSKILLT